MVFNFIFMARNGQFEQRAIYQKVKDTWYSATRMVKDGKVILERADPAAPPELLSELRKPIL